MEQCSSAVNKNLVVRNSFLERFSLDEPSKEVLNGIVKKILKGYDKAIEKQEKDFQVKIKIDPNISARMETCITEIFNIKQICRGTGLQRKFYLTFEEMPIIDNSLTKDGARPIDVENCPTLSLDGRSTTY